MDYTEINIVMGIIARTSVALILLRLWIVTKKVAKKDGILFRSLTTAWFFLAIPFWIHALFSIDRIVDIVPYIDILSFLQQWIWIVHVFAAIACGRFLIVLGKENKK